MEPSTIFQNLKLGKTPLIIIACFFLLFSFLTLLNFPLLTSNFFQLKPASSTLNSNLQSPINSVSSSSYPPNTSSFLAPHNIAPLSNTSAETESFLLASPPTRSVSYKESSLPKIKESSLVEKKKRSCDIFDGKWVFDDSYPSYPPGSCRYASRAFNCFNNGRSDVGYMKYRWQPHGCDIPRFDGKRMMEMLRGKRLVFIGDSLNRNMCQSLLCHLKMFKATKIRVMKKDGTSSFHFKKYNCSIVYIGAPFLVQRWQLPALGGATTPRETLRLDTIEDHSYKYHDADFLIFNTGHWWNHNKAKNGVNFFQEGDVVHDKMDVGKAYAKALNTWAKWVDENVNANRTKVFFVGFTATHFKGGRWNSGGSCHGETEPITDDKFLRPYPTMMKSLESVISKMKTPIVYLNITKMTDYRKDAHPSVYRLPNVKGHYQRIQDCSHWCLPGVPDSWNQLLYALLVS